MLKLPRSTDDRIALSGRVWNRAADEIERAAANLQVALPLELTDGPAGRRLGVRVKPDRLYWGVVECSGPIGDEPDFSDNRYWIALGFVSNDQSDAATALVKVTAYPPGDSRRKVIAATSFFEANDAAHSVRPQTVVRVWAEYDRGSPAQLRWTMIVADMGTNKADPCPGSSSSSASGGDGSSTSGASSTGSTGGSDGGGSGGSGACPPGYNGSLQIGGPITRVGDTVEQTVQTLTFCAGLLVDLGSPATVSAQVCCPPGSSASSSSSSASGSAGNCCQNLVFTYTGCDETGSATATLSGAAGTGYSGDGDTLVLDAGGYWRLTTAGGLVFTARPDADGCPPVDPSQWTNVGGCVGPSAAITSVTCADGTTCTPSTWHCVVSGFPEDCGLNITGDPGSAVMSDGCCTWTYSSGTDGDTGNKKIVLVFCPSAGTLQIVVDNHNIIAVNQTLSATSVAGTYSITATVAGDSPGDCVGSSGTIVIS